MPALANVKTRAEEAIARCRLLASFSEDRGSTRRTFLSPPMRDCHRELSRWLSAAGAEVRVDAVGNLRACYPAVQQSGAPRLFVGSHLDTVPNAGAFDGILGVVLAVALLEALGGRKFPFAVEIIGFSEEEGVRFGMPFIGSRALVGRIGKDVLNLRDANGVSVEAAIDAFGLHPHEILNAALKDDALAYLEFHIEQGPALDAMHQPLAAVEAIAGQTRMEFTFLGHANHAGTTPMAHRHDAVAAAAEWILAVENAARSISDLVATVGQVVVQPGAANVIAGEARVSLDLRHKSDGVRGQALDRIVRHADEIATRRGLRVLTNLLLQQNAVAMDEFLVQQIEVAIRKSGLPPHRMASGAGHDAMILAEEIPAAMIFLRTPGGISHDPAESVRVEDVTAALECGLHLLEQLSESPNFLKGRHRA